MDGGLVNLFTSSPTDYDLNTLRCCLLHLSFPPLSGNAVSMLSSKASPSNTLSSYIPPGTADHGFNITAIVLVSDKLGSTAITSLGEDGTPVTIVSTSPDEVKSPKSYGLCARISIAAQSASMLLASTRDQRVRTNTCVPPL